MGREPGGLMPIYEYAPIEGGCAQCGGRFEVLAKASDPDLAACPDCGQPVRRVISAPTVLAGQAHVLKESHVEKHGFTQYRRAGGGVYEKTAGKGPEFISGD